MVQSLFSISLAAKLALASSVLLSYSSFSSHHQAVEGFSPTRTLLPLSSRSLRSLKNQRSHNHHRHNLVVKSSSFMFRPLQSSNYDYDDKDDFDDERGSSSRRRRRRGVTTKRRDDWDNDIFDAVDQLEDDGIFDDDDDDDDYDYDDDEEGIFSDTVIPNPLLDSMDPDGAADRFPELASDWKFWVDIVLVIILLQFLSAIGTGDPFLQDFLTDLSSASLPPPIR